MADNGNKVPWIVSEQADETLKALAGTIIIVVVLVGGILLSLRSIKLTDMMSETLLSVIVTSAFACLIQAGRKKTNGNGQGGVQK